ncbi:hypothetical protein Tco_0919097 [Tanacetum coccineum]
MVVQEQAEMCEGSANPTDPHHTPTIIQPSPQPQKKQKPRKPNRKDTQIPQSSSPIASSLEVEQDSANDIASLKRRVKKIEKKNKSRTHKLKRLYKVGLSDRVESSRDEESLSEDASKQGRRITDIDDAEDITLVNDQIDVGAEMFDVDTLTGDEVLAEQVVAAKDVNLSVDEVTLAQALAALKSEKVQEKGDVIKEPSVPVSIVTASTKDKETKLIRLDEEIASKLQDEFDEEVRLAREKAEKEQEANVALIEEWDDIQAKIKVDHELAQRLQGQEQE